MRYRIGSINYSSGTVSIIGATPSICVYDNSTIVCNKGYTITTPGLCFSQGIGTINSASSCTSDYIGSLFGTYSLCNEGSGVDGDFSVFSYGGAVGFVEDLLIPIGVVYDEWVLVKAAEIQSVFDVVSWSDAVVGKISQYLCSFTTVADFKFLQLDSGWVVHLENASSQYFQFDIFGAVSILQPTLFSYAKIKSAKILVEGSIDTYHSTVVSGIGVSDGTVNPEVGGENPAEICIGDLIAPVIENSSPAQYSVLRPVDSVISFDIVDAIGGVNKSTVYVTVSGSETTQPEGVGIVSAGTPVAQASFNGTDARYSFIYTPTNDWGYNEVVTITVTGTDNVPDDIGGDSFSCYTGDPNQFGYSWVYGIEEHSDLSVYINAVADPEPPYVNNTFPPRWFGGVDSMSDISFYLLDDHAGVDLSSVVVYINDVAVVSYGEVIGAFTNITPVVGGYFIYYTNYSGFSYGSRVVVRVVGNDLYVTAPNTLDYSYYFDIVGTDSTIIENFYPAVGVTTDPELVNIRVDVTDDVYDIDESNLYLSINGTTVSADSEELYGYRDLTTVSGYETIVGATVSGVSLFSVDVNHVTISGSFVTLYSGILGSPHNISDGYFGEGLITDLSTPYNLSISGTIVSGTVFDGDLISGVISSALVSGINWDGNYEDSTLTGVDFSTLVATGVTISGTVISGTVGYRLSYHPPNDFNYNGTINVLVHGTNLSSLAPVTLEQVYQIFHGYNVKVYDKTFRHGSRVNVYLGAENTESFKNRLDYGYYFETIDQPSNNLTATIVGIAPWEDLGADITPQGPIHRYGETVQVEVYVEDIEGNALGPYTFSYTIEEAPE